MNNNCKEYVKASIEAIRGAQQAMPPEFGGKWGTESLKYSVEWGRRREKKECKNRVKPEDKLPDDAVLIASSDCELQLMFNRNDRYTRHMEKLIRLTLRIKRENKKNKYTTSTSTTKFSFFSTDFEIKT